MRITYSPSYGSGYDSINYTTIDVENPDDGEYYSEMDPDAKLIENEIVDKMKQNIGEYILKSGEIEKLVWQKIIGFFAEFDDPQSVITDIITKSDNKSKSALKNFKNIYINSDFSSDLTKNLYFNGIRFSFSEKKSLLKIIMENYPEKFAYIKIENLFNEIQEILDFRNALAHGQMTFDHKTKIASVFHFRKSKKEIKAFGLSDEKIKEYDRKFWELTMFLWDM